MRKIRADENMRVRSRDRGKRRNAYFATTRHPSDWEVPTVGPVLVALLRAEHPLVCYLRPSRSSKCFFSVLPGSDDGELLLSLSSLVELEELDDELGGVISVV